MTIDIEGRSIATNENGFLENPEDPGNPIGLLPLGWCAQSKRTRTYVVRAGRTFNLSEHR